MVVTSTPQGELLVTILAYAKHARYVHQSFAISQPLQRFLTRAPEAYPASLGTLSSIVGARLYQVPFEGGKAGHARI
jgi:hypothetical protein